MLCTAAHSRPVVSHYFCRPASVALAIGVQVRVYEIDSYGRESDRRRGRARGGVERVV